MMPKQTVPFTPRARDLFETSRIIEIAKAIARNTGFDSAPDINFNLDGRYFERMIEGYGFPRTRLGLEQRLTNETMDAGSGGR